MLNNTYRQALIEHPYGYALYEPESSEDLKPGVCGYISKDDGRFVPLIGDDDAKIDLTEPESLSCHGLTGIAPVQKAKPDKRYWGPKTSSRVNGSLLDFSANASLIPAGIPAEIGALYQFETSEEFGAILMTRSPVVRHAIYGTAAYRNWCRANTRALLMKWPDIRENGLIVVTSTYTTEHAEINAWQDKGKKVTVGFKTNAVDAFEIAPSSEWYKASSDGGWIASTSQGNEQRVVFFGGLLFTYRPLAPMLPQKFALQHKPLDKLRSAHEQDSCSLEFDGIELQMVGQTFGEILPPGTDEVDKASDDGDVDDDF